MKTHTIGQLRSKFNSRHNSPRPNIARAAEVLGLHETRIAHFVLRPLQSADLARLQEALSESPESNWTREPATPEYVESLLNYRLSHYKAFGFGVLAVETTDGQFVGQAGLQVLNTDGDQIEVVIFLRPTFVDRGVGRTLLAEIIRRARIGGIDCIYATIRDENDGAQRFFDRFGFVRIGEDIHFGHHCGVWIDSFTEARANHG